MKTKWRVGVMCLVSLTVPALGLMAQETAEEPGAGSAAPSLLSTIPDDASAFLAIRDLSELDKDIQNVSVEIGFPLGPEGMFPAPLEWLKSSLQMTEGLNEKGGAALVLLNAGKLKSVEDIPDHLVIYIPATDPKALLTSMGGEEGTEGLYRVSLGGSPSVATVRKGYVLVAKAPEGETTATPEALMAAAKAKGPGVEKAMAPALVDAYARQDISLWVNVPSLSEQVRKEILEGLQGLFAGMAGGGATQPAAGQGAEAVQQVEMFLTQADQLAVGILLSQKVGLDISLFTRVESGTDLAKMMAAQNPPQYPLLAGLPNEATILSAGAVVSTTPQALESMRKTAEGLAEQISSLDQDPDTPLTPENLKPLIDIYMNLLKGTQELALSISKIGSADQPEGGLIGLAMVVQVKDSKAWRGQVHEGFEKVKNIVGGVAKADGVEQEKVDQIMSAFTWQENAAEVAGASVDVLQVDLDKIPEIPPEKLEQVKDVIGQEGIVFRIAAVGDDQIVITFGGGEQRLAKTIGLAKAHEAPLAKRPNIVKISDRLPTGSRLAEGYISLANLLGLVDAISVRLQSPLPVQLSLRNAAPIAFTTVKLDELSQRVDLLIPSELITSIAEMVRQQLGPMIFGGFGGQMGQMGEEPGEPGEEQPVQPLPRRRLPGQE